MPGGHASHKGHSTKPNTNAPDVIDLPDGAPVDMPEIVTQSSTSTRPDEAPENTAATERPTDNQE